MAWGFDEASMRYQRIWLKNEQPEPLVHVQWQGMLRPLTLCGVNLGGSTTVIYQDGTLLPLVNCESCIAAVRRREQVEDKSCQECGKPFARGKHDRIDCVYHRWSSVDFEPGQIDGAKLKEDMRAVLARLSVKWAGEPPIPMILHCPFCDAEHVDRGEWASRPHKTHLCSNCQSEFRPANVYTVGVLELP